MKTVFLKVIQNKSVEWTELHFQHSNGSWIWLDVKAAPSFDETGQVTQVLFVSRDISNRKKYEIQLEEMAFYDFLTGVPNRRLFLDHLQQSMNQLISSKHSLAILSLDLDRFKWVNDTMGHDVGDELLIQFVQRVKACISEGDILARMGGDEFNILLPNIKSAAEVTLISEKILKATKKPWLIKGNEFTTTSSIGIVLCSDSQLNIKTLLKQADQILYKAKQLGKNNYQFFQEPSNVNNHTELTKVEEK